MHLNTLHAARKAFIESENCEEIKRALRHNIRAKLEKYETGEKVYFKREDSNKWRGPGVVIGQDKQVVFVRHGGYYVRVSTNRLMKVNTAACGSDDVVSTSIPANGESGQDRNICDENIGDTRATVNDDTQDIQDNCNPLDLNEPETSTNKCKSVCLKQRSIPKKGDHIRYKIKSDDEWKTAEVISRGGKQTGKYREWMNIAENGRDDVTGIDFSNVDQWEIVADKIPEEVAYIVIVPKTEHEHQKIIGAKEKELNLWKEMDVYEDVEDKGQSRISTSWVVSQKVIDTGVVFRARLVCRGFEEENPLKGDSPTCGKDTLRIFLSVASSMGFPIRAKDVKCAFLQGKPIERDVFVVPPIEAKRKNVLWKLKKVVYGLVDAARNWYCSVLKEIENVHCMKSKYDGALFYYKKNDILQGIMACHVDDFLDCGNASFERDVIDKISDKFKIGKEEDAHFKYVGINMKQSKVGVFIDQNHFLREIDEIQLDMHQGDSKDRLLTKYEHGDFRKVVGKLNWLVTSTRPDLAFEVLELSMTLKHPTIFDAQRANKAVRRAKSSSVCVLFPKMVLDQDLRLVTVSDAAFANLIDKISSGYGYLVLLVDRNGRCCPLKWRANKIQRVVGSTIAAEMLALLNAVKEAQYLREILIELLGKTSALHIQSFVDNKSVLDAVYSTKKVDDKRLRLDVAELKQYLEKGELNCITHVPGCQMIADGLTKRGASCKQLIETITSGVLPDFMV